MALLAGFPNEESGEMDPARICQTNCRRIPRLRFPSWISPKGVPKGATGARKLVTRLTGRSRKKNKGKSTGANEEPFFFTQSTMSGAPADAEVYDSNVNSTLFSKITAGRRAYRVPVTTRAKTNGRRQEWTLPKAAIHADAAADLNCLAAQAAKS